MGTISNQLNFPTGNTNKPHKQACPKKRGATADVEGTNVGILMQGGKRNAIGESSPPATLRQVDKVMPITLGDLWNLASDGLSKSGEVRPLYL